VRASLTLLAAGLALVALPARARPYLMLNADDRGFQALDLGGIDRSQPGTVQATLIDAPLAGIPVDDRLAPLAERRIEVDCAGAWWRVRSVVYVDGREQAMGQNDEAGEWTPTVGDDIAEAVLAAVCRRRYNQAMVSRYLNLGQILANFQSAHSKAATEPQTEKDLLDRRYRNGR
jgi:hypothetical protein